jgi:hypothetical protein
MLLNYKSLGLRKIVWPHLLPKGAASFLFFIGSIAFACFSFPVNGLSFLKARSFR